MNVLYWPSIIIYQLLPPYIVLYWPCTQLHHLVTHSWANWIKFKIDFKLPTNEWYFKNLIWSDLMSIFVFDHQSGNHSDITFASTRFVTKLKKPLLQLYSLLWLLHVCLWVILSYAKLAVKIDWSLNSCLFPGTSFLSDGWVVQLGWYSGLLSAH